VLIRLTGLSNKIITVYLQLSEISTVQGIDNYVHVESPMGKNIVVERPIIMMIMSVE
jgi:hypothetical protein